MQNLPYLLIFLLALLLSALAIHTQQLRQRIEVLEKIALEQEPNHAAHSP